MKTCIFQFYNDKKLPTWAQIGSNKFKEYANKVGADYIFDSESKFSPDCPYYENLRVVYDQDFDQYDKILYVDMDVIPESFENIFDLHIKDIGMVAEIKYPHMTTNPIFTTPGNQKLYEESLTRVGLKRNKIKDQYIIYNSGVILWTKEGRLRAQKKFMNWKDWFKAVKHKDMKLDQPFINSQLAYLELTELPLRWNCYPRERWEKGYFPKDAVFVHYTNKKKKWIEELYK